MIKILLSKISQDNLYLNYQVQHDLGLKLLNKGLNDFFEININREELIKLIKKSKYGKPLMPKFPLVHFNVSHCSGIVVCGFSNKPVGIDIENNNQISSALIKRALTPKEQLVLNQLRDDSQKKVEMFNRFWTLKESYFKLCDRRRFLNLQEFSFQIEINDGVVKNIKCNEDIETSFFQYQLAETTIITICSSEAMRLKPDIEICFL
jgi:4'-phosphopantetheinyl transferase